MAAFFSRPTSAAVKIIAPPRSDGSPAQIQSEQLQSKICSNITKFGVCQFEGQGCIFYHPPVNSHDRGQSERSLASSESSKTESTSQQPQSSSGGVFQTTQNINAPVFVPKGSLPNERILSGSLSHTVNSPPAEYEHDPYNPYDTSNPNAERDSPHQIMQGVRNMQLNDYDNMGLINNGTSSMVGGIGVRLDPYYSAPMNTYIRQPLNYHLYTPQAHHSNITKSDNPATSFFMSDTLRQDLTQRSEIIRSAPPLLMSNLPEELHGYHTLVPLDPPVALNGKERRPNFGNWYSYIYKAISATDGLTYALRRIENFRLVHESAFDVVEQWSKIRHPNIVSMHEAFTSRAFGDNSLIVSYDYHPGSVTLFDTHLKLSLHSQRSTSSLPNNNYPSTSSSALIPESVLWSYISQIGSSIQAAHTAGLAIRLIDSTKILITGKNRVRLGCCGIVDILTYDARQDVKLLQQEDLLQFGGLILALCCNNLMAGSNLTKSLENVTRNYSTDLKSVIIFLLGKPAPHKSINQLFDMMGRHLVPEVEALGYQADRLEGELSRELENGRLVRLLCKLGFINERPEFDCDPRWSETGDRYVIKLFRDYVFHQVDENGNPVMNLSHVLTCINKLDAGSEERILLISRDEQSCLVVSYREIKTCIESCISELGRRNNR